jgi:hypothetical protein
MAGQVKALTNSVAGNKQFLRHDSTLGRNERELQSQHCKNLQQGK